MKDHARCQREEIPPDRNPPWRAVEERNRVRELYSARPEWGLAIEGPHPGALSLELPGAEQSGWKAYRRSLGHACTIASSPSGAGCLPRQDVCSYIATKGRTDTNMLCPQSTFQELPVMGKEYASSRSLVTTSPRIWCEARACRELSELQSCD